MRKMGRFVVDTHVHAQRFAAGEKLRQAQKEHKENPSQTSYDQLNSVMHDIVAYDNSKRLFYDMDCYGVDMCVLSPAFGMKNALNMELVEKYPDKFVALCDAQRTAELARAGEIQWSMEEACKELDELLSTGKFVGIGEGMPHFPNPKGYVNEYQRLDEMLQVMEVARKHKVTVRYHTGTPIGYNSYAQFWPETFHPEWAHVLASKYPDVPIVFDHGGMQGWWWEHWVDQCLHVVASHDNVYLECGLYWTDLYYKALNDPNIGPEKLLWGTDWGASIPIYAKPGAGPKGGYAVQLRKEGTVKHQVDLWGWSLRQLDRLDISQDDLNLILGGNAIRLYHLPFPLTRMFRL